MKKKKKAFQNAFPTSATNNEHTTGTGIVTALPLKSRNRFPAPRGRARGKFPARNLPRVK